MNRYHFLSTAVFASLVFSLPLVASASGGITPGRDGAPDAGVMLNELEPGRHITPHPSQPKISVTVPKTEEVQQNLKARIDNVVFECADMDVNKLLQPVLKGKLHKELTFKDMQDLGLDCTKKLRSEGYMMAVAYPPAQDVMNNTLKIKVFIGRYGDVSITNTSKLLDKRLLDYTYALRPGLLINEKPLDKSLLILNDLPGMQVKATMEPGKKAGTAKLLLDAKTLERQGGYVYVDNYGSRSTGRFRYGGNYHFNNLTHVGDQLDFSFLASTKSMRNYQIRYNLPVRNDGAIAHIAFSHMNYDLGWKYSYMNGYGLANTWELGITVPMKRTLQHSSFYSVNYRHRELHDELFDVNNSSKTSDSIELETHGYMRALKDSFSYSVSHLFGYVGMNNAYTQTMDSILRTAGQYNKSGASLYYIHQFNNRLQAHVSLSGQYAWNNLDSSEDFYVGGADGVRAFPQGETGGDSGILGTVEFDYSVGIPGLQVAAFLDAGRVFYNHDSNGISGDNVRNLVGVGLGLIYTKSRDWYAKLDWATPLGDHYSAVNGEDVNNMVWFRVVKQL